MREGADLLVTDDLDTELVLQIVGILPCAIEVARNPAAHAIGNAVQPTFDIAERIGKRGGRVRFSIRVTCWCNIEGFVRTPMPVVVLAANERGIVGVLEAAVVRADGGSVVRNGA